MSVQKPTEVFLAIARAIVPEMLRGGVVSEGNVWAREFGESRAADVLASLDAAGYVIVPREPAGDRGKSRIRRRVTRIWRSCRSFYMLVWLGGDNRSIEDVKNRSRDSERQ